jgi:hypothetical protein
MLHGPGYHATSVCVQAVFRARTIPLGSVEDPLCGFKDVYEGFEELWNLRGGIGRGTGDSSVV